MYQHLSEDEGAESEKECNDYDLSFQGGYDDTGEYNTHDEVFPVQSSEETSDLSDLFEGEIDSAIFAPAANEDPQVSVAWAAFQDARDQESNFATTLPSTRLRRDCLAIASGGVGHGDTPYDEHTFRFDHPEHPGIFFAPEISSGSSETESPIHVNSRQRARETIQQTFGHEIDHKVTATASDTQGRKESQEQERDHSSELPWDNYRKPVGTEVYSPSVSSSSSSDLQDDTCSQLRVDDVQVPDQETRTNSRPLPTSETNVLNSEGEQSIQTISTPILLQKRPYLSEVTPAVSQSHHPSLIPRSPQKDNLRTSSLGVASLKDTPIEEETRPASISAALLRETEVRLEEGASDVDTQSVPTAPQVWLHSQLLGDKWNSFRPSIDSSTSASSDGTVPLRTSVSTIFAQVVSTSNELSTCSQPLGPSRPDTPRPFVGTQGSGFSENSEAQILGTSFNPHSVKEEFPLSHTRLDIRPPAYTQGALNTGVNNATVQSVRPHRELLDSWNQPRYSTASAPSHLGPAATTFSLSGQPVQYAYASQSVPGVIVQYDNQEVQPRLQLESLSRMAPPTQRDSVPLDEPWQEPPQIPDGLNRRPPGPQNTRRPMSTQALTDSTICSSSTIGLSQAPSQEEFIQPTKRPSDPFAANKDEILFSASTLDVSPPLSPLAGLRGAIHQAKRDVRKATSSKRKPTRNVTSTRGRAVSASPKKTKSATVMSGIAVATGVQDVNAKVGKTKKVQDARRTSRKVTVQRHKMDDEIIPDVPHLPEDMEIDAPEAQSYSSSTHERQQQDLKKKKTPSKKRVPRDRKATPTRATRQDAQMHQSVSPEEQPAASHLRVPKIRVTNPRTRKTKDTPSPSHGTQIDISTSSAPPISVTSHIQTPEDGKMDIDALASRTNTSTEEVEPPSAPSTPTQSGVKRRATPGPRRTDRNQNKTVPIPRTPESKERPAMIGSTGDSVLTPNSAAQKTPLRSSPRLRGEPPGPGL